MWHACTPRGVRFFFLSGLFKDCISPAWSKFWTIKIKKCPPRWSRPWFSRSRPRSPLMVRPNSDPLVILRLFFHTCYFDLDQSEKSESPDQARCEIPLKLSNSTMTVLITPWPAGMTTHQVSFLLVESFWVQLFFFLYNKCNYLVTGCFMSLLFRHWALNMNIQKFCWWLRENGQADHVQYLTGVQASKGTGCCAIMIRDLTMTWQHKTYQAVSRGRMHIIRRSGQRALRLQPLYNTL